MTTRQLYRFRISYKLNGTLHLVISEGLNLRHAKDKILFSYPEATDLRDWTFERDEDLLHYLHKNEVNYLRRAELIKQHARVPH